MEKHTGADQRKRFYMHVRTSDTTNNTIFKMASM